MNSENSQTLTSGQTLGKYVPPKAWTEITIDEKIERMRDIIKNQSNQLGRAQQEIHQLRLKLRNHDHIDGKVFELREMKDYYEGELGTGIGVLKSSTENFF